jgi:DnaJ-class molecular chaperone
LLLGSWCATLGVAAAQDGPKYPIPEKIERATKADDKGVLQWEAWAEPKCPNCNGTGKMKCPTCARFADDAKTCPECKRNKEREAVCRTCAGTGKLADPLEKVVCPACLGAAFLLCMVCHGGGQLKVDKAKQWSDCPGCRGEGGFKCVVCNGTRMVEVAAVKPSLKDGTPANLEKALAATDQALKELAAFTPSGGEKARKEVKALCKTLDTAGAVHPSLKRLPKFLEDYMGKIYGGAQFQGHEEHEAQAMGQVQTNCEYYLKHQKRMMELAQKRAEANAKLAADQKGK